MKGHKVPIWLLWATTQNSLVTLASVALDAERASTYKRVIEQDSNVVTVRVEKTEANHLYHPNWEDAWQNAYGEDHLKEYARQSNTVLVQRCKVLESELKRCREALGRAARRIEELEGKP